uniref:Purinergic receptor P2X, ligand-gated ion channel, 4b n=1 Tax=Nothobranchius furzeri TaxID=105023 RepID=A0A8C6Q134_NOTFU
MSKPAGCFRSLLHYVFDYETPKTLVIPSLGVGFVYRFTQLLVVLYVLGYVCVWCRKPTRTQTVISTVTTKVKGLAFTNTSDVEPRFWDAADMINPPQSDRSFIVLTNMVITPGQTQARCPEVRRYTPMVDGMLMLLRCVFERVVFLAFSLTGAVCDLDWWAGKCYPRYSFRRLDNKNPVNNVAPVTTSETTFFRFETRTLIKAYGIRFDVIVFGTAGKFGIVPTIVNLGAALSFLSLVPLVTDWFMVTCTRKLRLYSLQKAAHLTEEADAESVSDSHTFLCVCP